MQIGETMRVLHGVFVPRGTEEAKVNAYYR